MLFFVGLQKHFEIVGIVSMFEPFPDGFRDFFRLKDLCVCVH